MKMYIDAEQARKEDREREKKEKEKRKQEERERELREEEARVAREKREEKRRIKKEEEKRKEADFRKGKAPVYSSGSDDDKNPSNSDVEALSEQAEGLVISEKRKCSAERVVGDSPPMVTPAKHPTKRGQLDPKRLVLSCRHPALKRSPTTRKTPVRSLMKKKKILATVGQMGKLRYVTDNLRELGDLNVDELKQICREEDVQFEEKKKMDTIFVIMEKRTHVAYGVEGNDEETTEVTIKEGMPYPRVGGHVRFKLQDLEGVNPLICNANNVPKLKVSDHESLLAREIATGFSMWINSDKDGITVQRREVIRCMSKTVRIGEKYLDTKDVEALKEKQEGLVLTPLDRNLGETLVMCPKLYFDAMMDMFVLSTGYTIVNDSETTIQQKMKDDARASGLQQFVRWDSKGCIGSM
ncbi:hypothetical protein CBR_g12836 [Chara braunii]|uniref:Uncharacterized protein n=1 Tax=Chara braunii TaxID=69332 RepID=A0A388KSV2_CHABU|nr:hypothetical protein CBR_g12836 [Chara braunii]|eukprot:GBG73119.1 hypothetical protein CBR_g12836 [Chara braunii]